MAKALNIKLKFV